MQHRIGIDIGGTNTDAALVDDRGRIIATAKSPTTPDIVSGVLATLRVLARKTHVVAGVFVGTTHGINALLTAKRLSRIGLLRLAGYHPDVIEPCHGWPAPLKKAVFTGSHTVCGGHQCDGRPIGPLEKGLVLAAAEDLVTRGAQALVINGVFGPLHRDHEVQVEEWLQRHFGNAIPVQTSYRIGSAGFIERENAALLNASLKQLMQAGFSAMQATVRRVYPNAPLFITQNNGTVMSLDKARENPILTLAAGPKNSFVGAAKLAEVSCAVVADIGGTSTDIGVVQDGFARRSYKRASIAGVSLAFPMPDVLTVGLGGGSHLNCSSAPYAVGPDSVSRALLTEARSFGGPRLTLTDAAIASGSVVLPGAVACMEPKVAHDVMLQVRDRLLALCQRSAGRSRGVPVLWVGGGAKLFAEGMLSGAAGVPAHAESANAYGAALSELAATFDTVVDLQDRDATLKRLEDEVLQQAVDCGASNPRIVERQVLPFHYMPGNRARVTMTAAGPMGRAFLEHATRASTSTTDAAHA